MKTRSKLMIAVLLAVNCLPLAAQDPTGQPKPGFRVAVNMVLVNASVTGQDGKRQPDLRPEDFELFEDGVRQEVKFFRSSEAPFHVALVVDSSGSTVGKLNLIRKAADRFLRTLSPEDRVCLVDVAGRVQVLQEFTGDRRLLSRKLRRIGTTEEDGTVLRDAMLHVLDHLFRGIQGRKAIVFLTDAQDSGSKSRIEELKQAVYVSDAVLYGLLVETEQDLTKAMQGAAETFSRIALVLEASSGSGVKDVKEAGRFLVDRLPASAEVCLVEHRSPRRAVLLVPFTRDRKQLKQAIANATVEPRTIDTPSGWKASGAAILITDNDFNLPNRIQADILRACAVLVLNKRPAKEWQEELQAFARQIPEPSGLRQTLKELPANYRDARQAVAALCDHSGGRSFDLIGTSDLDSFYQQVAEELRRTYSLGYYSQAGSRQYHRLEVRVRKEAEMSVRARRGFLLP